MRQEQSLGLMHAAAPVSSAAANVVSVLGE